MNKSTASFRNGDLLNREPFADRFESFLRVESDYVEGSLVVALAAPFGSGKTTFLDMWKTSLLERRDKDLFAPMPVSLNAWESDHAGDPMVPILTGLIDAIAQWKGEGAPDENTLREAAKDAAWFTVSLANGLVAKATGLDALKAEQLATEKREKRADKIPDFITFHQERQSALEHLKSVLRKAFGGPQLKVVVLVDELDRCRPDYAISYLETIKHVFDIEGMAFVLAVDYEHLETSAKGLYGSKLKFDEYFRKFCHRLVRLPDPDKQGYARLIPDYIKKYLSIEGRRSSGINIPHRHQDLVDLARHLNMNPRQIQETFRVLGHTTETVGREREGELPWCMSAATILLAYLRTSHSSLYESIRRGDVEPDTLPAFLIKALGPKDAQWWIQVILTGSLPKGEGEEWILSVMTDAGLTKEQLEDGGIGRLHQYHQGWGHSHIPTDHISAVVQRIENAGQFFEPVQ